MVCVASFNDSNTCYPCSLGIISHLKHFPTMYWLYCVLKDCPEPPTAEEIVFASGKNVLDPQTNLEYLKNLEVATVNIQKAFATKWENTAVSLFVLFSSWQDS